MSHTYLGTFDVVMQVVSESVDQVDCVVLSLFTYVSGVENCKKWSTNKTQSFTEKHNCPQLSSLREPLSSLSITGMAVWLDGHMSSKPYKLPCRTDKQWQCNTRIVRSWVKIDNTLLQIIHMPQLDLITALWQRWLSYIMQWMVIHKWIMPDWVACFQS